MLLPACKPFTSLNTVETFIFCEKVEWRLPMANIPPNRKTSPTKINTPTTTARFLIDSLITLLYEIIMIETLYLFMLLFEHLFKFAYSFKLAIEQHGYAITGLFGAGKIMGNDNRSSVIFFFYFIHQVIDLFAGYRIKSRSWFIVEHDLRF